MVGGRRGAYTLSRVLTKGHTASGELKAYNERWMTEWRRLQSIDGGLLPRPNTDPWINANFDRLLPCIPAHGGELFRLAGQLNLEVAIPQPV